jgi:hypothetical protein
MKDHTPKFKQRIDLRQSPSTACITARRREGGLRGAAAGTGQGTNRLSEIHFFQLVEWPFRPEGRTPGTHALITDTGISLTSINVSMAAKNDDYL